MVIETKEAEFVFRPTIRGVREMEESHRIFREGFENILVQEFFVHDNGSTKCRSHEVSHSK